ncbi:putative RNA helicase [Helianthus annuus]|uniref:RNA helicase n=1 Tax=Helianthus annuus TaxID=4232 RepID=A0A9K3N5J6_HELAN|nr:putative RNA helicase [Helianthus annuus]KAJ0514892.1 putative RNA helicase [Helianthus annuus]KAJ0523214.1 putative RNA helicase [Helianthus annuus]KAJ0531056.1 putative RNA helicase [Helianthus annuus]KAJ0697904.1 putative RNA helicase [Helianthus annuus]
MFQMIKERQFQPVIIFSYSRRECQQHAMAMAKLDFNSQEEKDNMDLMFKNAMLYLSEEDRNLLAIQSMLPLLRRDIAIHHYGLLPIIEELVELMFQEDLVKAFAMGLNMPAKMVVFTSVRKGDGNSHHYIDHCEYIQMSGRAGRRGKEEYGICIIVIDNQSIKVMGRKLAKLKAEVANLDASGEIQRERKLEVNVDEYVMAAIRPSLMDVIYHWSKVSSSQSI